jgi:hypothetical protein
MGGGIITARMGWEAGAGEEGRSELKAAKACWAVDT